MPNFTSPGINPSLIHPVPVKLQRINKATTMYDDNYREPVNPGGPQYKPEETVEAQIHWWTDQQLDPAPGGDDQSADGHLTMRRTDFEGVADGPYQVGDKIVDINGQDMRESPLYIIEARASGHYATNRLWKFYFKSRSNKPHGDTENRPMG